MGVEADLEGAFTDIEALAKECRFNNCSHTSEPDCAVLQAVAMNTLDGKRLESYFKFQKELRFLETKVDENAAIEQRQHEKKLGKYYKQTLHDIYEIKGK
ncbi:ribosome small subunit-dependent GTPase [Candidatus Saccharibacteria bacterium]|nr:MAG: ribosome small subunit-dependent GTPase [Candidatus Saccharibacteria bacterium]